MVKILKQIKKLISTELATLVTSKYIVTTMLITIIIYLLLLRSIVKTYFSRSITDIRTSIIYIYIKYNDFFAKHHAIVKIVLMLVAVLSYINTIECLYLDDGSATNDFPTENRESHGESQRYSKLSQQERDDIEEFARWGTTRGEVPRLSNPRNKTEEEKLVAHLFKAPYPIEDTRDCNYNYKILPKEFFQGKSKSELIQLGSHFKRQITYARKKARYVGPRGVDIDNMRKWQKSEIALKKNFGNCFQQYINPKKPASHEFLNKILN